MISNQILQNTIDGLKGISKVDFSVLDTEGKELASTLDNAQERNSAVISFVESPADSQVIQGCQFFKIFDEQRLEYVLLAEGDSETAYMLGKVAAFQIHSLLVAYKERFDKDNFIKNLLLDNLLLVDIYNRAKKLHIDTEVKRVIFIIETSHEKDNAALENVRNLLGGKSKDFITAVDEKNIIVVKELTEKDGAKELEKMAKEMLDMLKEDTKDEQIRIAYGTIISDIKEVSKSYKEAKLALDVGKIFFAEKDIVAFTTLGIGRLIYQLPIPLCKMFIKDGKIVAKSKFGLNKMQYKVPDGLLYPVVAAFRSLLVKNKVTGKYEWKNGVGPIDVWDNNKEDLVNKIMNFAASIGDNPNAVGKDSNIWDLAYMTIMLRNMP